MAPFPTLARAIRLARAYDEDHGHGSARQAAIRSAALDASAVNGVHIYDLSDAFVRAGRITLHEVRQSAARLVRETDVRGLPHEAPRMMRGPWLIEIARPEKGHRLFDATHSLAGRPLPNGRIVLIGIGGEDTMTAEWAPTWGRSFDDVEIREDNMFAGEVAALSAWGRAAVTFAVTFALLLEADGSPLDARDETELSEAAERGRPKAKRSKPAKADPQHLPGGWVTRHIYLGDRVPEPTPTPTPTRATGSEPEGTPTQVQVRGHIRRQRHGPGNAEIKWVYVQAYTATRIASTSDAKVVVHG